MSRWIKEKDGKTIEEIADTNECRWLYDEVCCNPECDQCCDFPDTEEYCPKCPHFEKEEVEA